MNAWDEEEAETADTHKSVAENECPSVHGVVCAPHEARGSRHERNAIFLEASLWSLYFTTESQTVVHYPLCLYLISGTDPRRNWFGRAAS